VGVPHRQGLELDLALLAPSHTARALAAAFERLVASVDLSRDGAAARWRVLACAKESK